MRKRSGRSGIAPGEDQRFIPNHAAHDARRVETGEGFPKPGPWARCVQYPHALHSAHRTAKAKHGSNRSRRLEKPRSNRRRRARTGDALAAGEAPRRLHGLSRRALDAHQRGFFGLRRGGFRGGRAVGTRPRHRAKGRLPARDARRSREGLHAEGTQRRDPACAHARKPAPALHGRVRRGHVSHRRASVLPGLHGEGCVDSGRACGAYRRCEPQGQAAVGGAGDPAARRTALRIVRAHPSFSLRRTRAHARHQRARRPGRHARHPPFGRSRDVGAPARIRAVQACA